MIAPNIPTSPRLFAIACAGSSFVGLIAICTLVCHFIYPHTLFGVLGLILLLLGLITFVILFLASFDFLIFVWKKRAKYDA